MMDRYYNKYCKKNFCLLIMVCMIVQFAGCAIEKSVQPAIPEQKTIEIIKSDGFQWPDDYIEKRFIQYWSYRQSGESAKMFEFEAPHIKEMVMPRKYEGFYGKPNKDWKAIRVEKLVKLSEQLVVIEFNMLTTDTREFRKKIYFKDHWLFYSGEWFHVVKDPLFLGDSLGK